MQGDSNDDGSAELLLAHGLLLDQDYEAHQDFEDATLNNEQFIL